MDSVALLPTRTVIVNSILASCPHGPCAFVEQELSCSFTKPIDSPRWQLQVNLLILVCKEDGRVVCMYHCALRHWIDELKAKRTFEYLKASGLE